MRNTVAKVGARISHKSSHVIESAREAIQFCLPILR